MEKANLLKSIRIEDILVVCLFINTEIEVRIITRLQHKVDAAKIFEVVDTHNWVVVTRVLGPAHILHRRDLWNHPLRASDLLLYLLGIVNFGNLNLYVVDNLFHVVLKDLFDFSVGLVNNFGNFRLDFLLSGNFCL